MQMIDAEKHQTYFKVCVYGNPGTGKTNFGVSAPSPFFLLSELQAVPHVKAAARRLKKPIPPMLAVDNISVMHRAFEALEASLPTDKELVLKDESGKEIWRGPRPKTIVVDSLTDAMKLIENAINEQSPPKIGKDGLPAVSERYWNELGLRGQKMIRKFRDLPFNVIFLCLMDDKTSGEGETAERVIKPSLPMRSLVGTLAAAVNVVGYTTREFTKTLDEDKNKVIEYGIRTSGPAYCMLKPMRPLNDIEVTNFSDWVARLEAAEVDPDENIELPHPLDESDAPHPKNFGILGAEGIPPDGHGADGFIRKNGEVVAHDLVLRKEAATAEAEKIRAKKEK